MSGCVRAWIVFAYVGVRSSMYVYLYVDSLEEEQKKPDVIFVCLWPNAIVTFALSSLSIFVLFTTLLFLLDNNRRSSIQNVYFILFIK